MLAKMPTLDDYRRLERAYQQLLGRYEQAIHEHTAMHKEYTVSQQALREQTRRAMQIQSDLDAALARQTELETALIQQAAQAQQEAARDAAQEAAQEAAEWQDRYLRLQAEMESYRRRLETRLQGEMERARNQLLTEMLPLADHLEMGLNHLAEHDPGLAESGFAQSIQTTLRAFLDSLRKYGVAGVDALGQPFDPQMHEAVAWLPHDQIPADHVASVVRSGYQIYDQLLRPAQVIVSSGPAAQGSGSTSAN
jgi:molecular chaperone GrpE